MTPELIAMQQLFAEREWWIAEHLPQIEDVELDEEEYDYFFGPTVEMKKTGGGTTRVSSCWTVNCKSDGGEV